MKKRKLLCVLMTSFMLTPVALSDFWCNFKTYALESKISLNELLNYLDFVCAKQKEAFKDLCEEAGIKINENFDVNEALHLVELTQKQFFGRSGKQERWETAPLQWINKNPDKVLECLKKLGFIDSVFAKETVYDGICILGAAGPTMKNRIKFTEKLIEQGLKTSKIVLLAGERYLTEKIDGTQQEILEVSEFFGIEPQKLTETHLFKYLYKKSNLNNNFELVVIDTPQKNGCRPTTQTTIEDFLEWRKEHLDIKNVLFISNQPSIKYQDAVITEVLYSNKSDLVFETVGDEYKQQNLQRAVGELGAYIWAVMPQIFRSMNINVDSNFIESVNKLYGHQPLIYQGLLNLNNK